MVFIISEIDSKNFITCVFETHTVWFVWRKSNYYIASIFFLIDEVWLSFYQDDSHPCFRVKTGTWRLLQMYRFFPFLESLGECTVFPCINHDTENQRPPNLRQSKDVLLWFVHTHHYVFLPFLWCFFHFQNPHLMHNIAIGFLFSLLLYKVRCDEVTHKAMSFETKMCFNRTSFDLLPTPLSTLYQHFITNKTLESIFNNK